MKSSLPGNKPLSRRPFPPPGPLLRPEAGRRPAPPGEPQRARTVWARAGFALLLLALFPTAAAAQAQEAPAASPEKRPPGMAPDATLEPEELIDFDRQPAPVQELIRQALLLTKADLTYRYGSADPESGGIDCSGFVYYVLRRCGLGEVPRSASGQYVWVRKAGLFRAVLSRDPKTFELDELRPGDLLFWEGTYATPNDPPVTHAMIYLGREKASGERVMVGASDGRSYRGKPRWGASVFDFWPTFSGKNPSPGSSRFVGYGRIPGLGAGERSADRRSGP